MAGTLELLGTFRIAIEAETTRRIESDKGRALLAYLALEPGRAHGRSTLAGLLWPDESPSAARHNLSQALFNLRRVFGANPDEAPVLRVERATLQWNPDADVWVDVHEIEALLAASMQHVHPDATTCEACTERRTRIVALYRGTLLEGLEVRDSDVWEDWLSQKRRGLEHVVLAQLEELTRFHASRRAFDQALDYALRTVAIDPWREEAHRQLIALHQAAGNRPAALAYYERWRAMLHAELGIEPAAETQAVYERVLQQPALLVPSVRPLPLAGPCIGRTMELQMIERLLHQGTRLLTITGPGGAGKTRLALEVARRHRGRVAFVPLASSQTGSQIVRAIADAIGCVLDPGMDPWDQVLRCLNTQPLLLVLDNFEHLMDAAHNVNDILQHAPDVAIVVTSRERLGLGAETVFALGGLGTNADETDSESVELFIAVARWTQPSWTPHDEERRCITRICQALGGLPLAIELAAGWIGVLSCAEIEQELSRDLDLLRSSLRDAPSAHQSMRHVFERSWTLLAVPEQQILRQLSVFTGGFDRRAAIAVVHDGGAAVAPSRVLDRLQALVNASLCQANSVDGFLTRYHFHPLVERYAVEQLARSDEQAITRRRHALYFLEFAERAYDVLEQSHAEGALADLEREHANLRAALTWTLHVEPRGTMALRLVRALAPFWFARAYWDEGRVWFEQVLQAEPPDSIELADVLLAAGSLATLQADTTQARSWLERSRHMYQTLGNRHGYARCSNQLGSLAEFEGDDNAARILHEESIAVLRDLDNIPSLAAALSDLGDVVRRQGGDATALYEESHALARRTDDPRLLSRSLYDLAVLLREHGEVDPAAAMLEESVALARTLGDRLALLGSLTQLGETERLRGDIPKAIVLQEASLQAARSLGSSWSIAWALLNLGRAVEAGGDRVRAQRLFEEALANAERAGDQHRIAESTTALVKLTTDDGSPTTGGRATTG